MFKRALFAALVLIGLLTFLIVLTLRPLYSHDDNDSAFSSKSEYLQVAYKITTAGPFPSVVKLEPSMGWLSGLPLVLVSCRPYLSVRLEFDNGEKRIDPTSSGPVFAEKTLECEKEMLDKKISEIVDLIPLDVQSKYYRFPFDTLTLKLDTDLVLIGGKEPLTFQASQWIAAPAFDGWEVKILPRAENGKVIVLRRPLLLRILLPIIVIALCILIALIPLLEPMSDAIGVSIALALGIWGIRQAIVPPNAPHVLAIEVLLLGDSVAIFIALVGSILFDLRRKYKKLKAAPRLAR